MTTLIATRTMTTATTITTKIAMTMLMLVTMISQITMITNEDPKRSEAYTTLFGVSAPVSYTSLYLISFAAVLS